MKKWKTAVYLLSGAVLSGCSSRTPETAATDSSRSVVVAPQPPVPSALSPNPVTMRTVITENQKEDSRIRDIEPVQTETPRSTRPSVTYNPSPNQVSDAQESAARLQRELESERAAAQREKNDRDRARRAAEERATMQRLEDSRRQRELEASQRRIERYETEKRDIARSSGDDGFKRYQIETRDIRIKNERRRMEETARR